MFTLDLVFMAMDDLLMFFKLSDFKDTAQNNKIFNSFCTRDTSVKFNSNNFFELTQTSPMKGKYYVKIEIK